VNKTMTNPDRLKEGGSRGSVGSRIVNDGMSSDPHEPIPGWVERAAAELTELVDTRIRPIKSDD
jgi:hypothetical protein